MEDYFYGGVFNAMDRTADSPFYPLLFYTNSITIICAIITRQNIASG